MRTWYHMQFLYLSVFLLRNFMIDLLICISAVLFCRKRSFAFKDPLESGAPTFNKSIRM